jgi:hypothetical protein
MKEFILNNWLEIVIALMAFIKVITNLTPTEDDNKVFSYMDKIINAFVPNYNKKGGKH